MAKKFAEIRGLHTVFEFNSSISKYDISSIKTEKQDLVNRNTICFVIADDVDSNRIVENTTINTGDKFIIVRNKLFAVYEAPHSKEVFTGWRPVSVGDIQSDEFANLNFSVNSANNMYLGVTGYYESDDNQFNVQYTFDSDKLVEDILEFISDEVEKLGVTGLSGAIEEIKICVSGLQEEISGLSGAIEEIKSGVSGLQECCEGVSGKINDIELGMSGLSGAISGLSGKIEEIEHPDIPVPNDGYLIFEKDLDPSVLADNSINVEVNEFDDVVQDSGGKIVGVTGETGTTYVFSADTDKNFVAKIKYTGNADRVDWYIDGDNRGSTGANNSTAKKFLYIDTLQKCFKKQDFPSIESVKDDYKDKISQDSIIFITCGSTFNENLVELTDAQVFDNPEYYPGARFIWTQEKMFSANTWMPFFTKLDENSSEQRINPSVGQGRKLILTGGGGIKVDNSINGNEIIITIDGTAISGAEGPKGIQNILAGDAIRIDDDVTTGKRTVNLERTPKNPDDNDIETEESKHDTHKNYIRIQKDTDTNKTWTEVNGVDLDSVFFEKDTPIGNGGTFFGDGILQERLLIDSDENDSLYSKYPYDWDDGTTSKYLKKENGTVYVKQGTLLNEFMEHILSGEAPIYLLINEIQCRPTPFTEWHSLLDAHRYFDVDIQLGIHSNEKLSNPEFLKNTFYTDEYTISNLLNNNPNFFNPGIPEFFYPAISLLRDDVMAADNNISDPELAANSLLSVNQGTTGTTGTSGNTHLNSLSEGYNINSLIRNNDIEFRTYIHKKVFKYFPANDFYSTFSSLILGMNVNLEYGNEVLILVPASRVPNYNFIVNQGDELDVFSNLFGRVGQIHENYYNSGYYLGGDDRYNIPEQSQYPVLYYGCNEIMIKDKKYYTWHLYGEKHTLNSIDLDKIFFVDSIRKD